MKVLIIGSHGMLGQEFMRQLGVASESSRSLSAATPNGNEVVGWGREDLDITNETEVMEKIGALKPSVIFNCAAYNNVDKAEDEPEIAFAINGEAVGYLAKAAAASGATLVHFSTDYVFDGEQKEGYTEEDLPNPISVYGQSKTLGEQRLFAISQFRNFANWYLIRTSKLFGPPGTGATSKKSFPEMMLGFARAKGRIEAIDAEIGSPTYVKDLAERCLQLIEQKMTPGIYHIVNDGACGWYEYAKIAVESAGVTAEVVPVGPEKFPRKAKRPAYSILLNTKLLALRPWQEALKEFLIQG